jgi:hypothetical protein
MTQKIEQLKQIKSKSDSKQADREALHESTKRKKEPEVESANKQARLESGAKLPKDFFDKSQQSPMTIDTVQEPLDKVGSEDVKSLPIGFFDDPKLESKAQDLRKSGTSNDQQWNAFKKEIAFEERKAAEPEADLEADLHELQHERDLDEAGEQIEYWTRLNQLEKKKNEKNHTKSMQIDESKIDSNEDDEAGDDEDLEREFMSWRNKPKVRS